MDGEVQLDGVLCSRAGPVEKGLVQCSCSDAKHRRHVDLTIADLLEQCFVQQEFAVGIQGVGETGPVDM